MEDSIEELAEKIKVCQLCRLHKSRSQAVPGEGNPQARIMFIGEAPGREEDRLGRPFVGQAGKLLDEALKQAGLEREEVFITNIVKCRPPGNRPPRVDETEACAAYLKRQIELIGPEVICLLGNTAVQALLKETRSVRKVRGELITRNERRYFATFHPAAALYDASVKPLIFKDIARLRTVMMKGSVKPSKKLETSFYDQDTVELAKQLLGKVIVVNKQGVTRKCRIVEVEAYLRGDPAAHSYRGETQRNRSMFMKPGTLYVFTMHRQHCMNIVRGEGEAVLIRAAEPISNIEDPTNGPGKLCKALHIKREKDDGKDLTTSNIWIEEDGYKPDNIACSRRIGISKAKERMLRFYIKGSQWISATPKF